jgi:hypothetical protein
MTKTAQMLLELRTKVPSVNFNMLSFSSLLYALTNRLTNVSKPYVVVECLFD